MHFLSEAATTAVGEVAEAGEDELDLGPNRILHATTQKLMFCYVECCSSLILLFHMFTTINHLIRQFVSSLATFVLLLTCATPSRVLRNVGLL